MQLQKFFFCAALTLGLLLAGCGQEKQPEYQRYQKQWSEPELSVYMHETGEIRQMKLEKYLEGVVAGEMKNDWEPNALAAQAILARTYTLQAFEKGKLTSKGTHASTDIEEFQAYNEKAVNDRVREAVTTTRGEVAAYNGIPIIGWFHASAGGKTALAKEGLDYPYEEPPFIQSVDSPDELAPQDIQNWTASYSREEVRAALVKMEVSVDEIASLEIAQKGPSGRAVTLKVNGQTEVSAPKLRLALGSTKLKSMLLQSIAMEGNNVVFRGGGYGHGVGMSQWGARKMAVDGKSPEEIVQHYFKDVVIEKRW